VSELEVCFYVEQIVVSILYFEVQRIKLPAATASATIHFCSFGMQVPLSSVSTLKNGFVNKFKYFRFQCGAQKKENWHGWFSAPSD